MYPDKAKRNEDRRLIYMKYGMNQSPNKEDRALMVIE